MDVSQKSKMEGTRWQSKLLAVAGVVLVLIILAILGSNMGGPQPPSHPAAPTTSSP